MTETTPDTPDNVCPTCGSVLHLAGQQHEVWDRRIEALKSGSETFETLDEDPVTRLPDGIALKADSGKWLSVAEVRALYEEHYQAGSWYPLEDIIEDYGHDKPYAPPANDPESRFAQDNPVVEQEEPVEG